ncbi:MAG: hypothetical protein MjAS7_0840 [Metallosphaera javensis (ex Sakai et al. 2022)]|nr:MAG: hypothetical protein MjAS7_0840 [Metallosphaera javensis (ex Sakai et al. 2022)]
MLKEDPEVLHVGTKIFPGTAGVDEGTAFPETPVKLEPPPGQHLASEKLANSTSRPWTKRAGEMSGKTLSPKYDLVRFLVHLPWNLLLVLALSLAFTNALNLSTGPRLTASSRGYPILLCRKI